MVPPIGATPVSIEGVTTPGWGNGFNAEPNTKHDREDGFVWPTADTKMAGARVYLDAVLVQAGVGDASTPANDNAGVNYQVVALFGVWKDCNADGAIGNGLQLTYSSTLLPPNTPCKPTPPKPGAGTTAVLPPHNDGTTVRELLWVVPEPSDPPSPDEWVDPGVQVWADYGYPGSEAEPNPLDPAPKHAPDFTLHYAHANGSAAAGKLDPARSAGHAACVLQNCKGWMSNIVNVHAPTVRTTAGDTVAIRASPAATPALTTYAYVSPNAITTSQAIVYKSGGALYASQSCQTKQASWDCNAAHWAGTIKPYQLYTLRDVDPLRYADLSQRAPTDEDADGVGDAWAAAYELVSVLTDVDFDQASTLKEFQWDTIPIPLFEHAQDYDEDAWLDGAEIAYWDAHEEAALYSGGKAAGVAMSDPDASLDTDRDGRPNHKDNDSDNDLFPDGAEVRDYQSYPEFADSDCALTATECTPGGAAGLRDPRRGSPGTGDNISDSDEAAFWNATLGPRGWAKECDSDDIPNLLDPDSDGDRLLDGAEIRPPAGVEPTDPCDPDSDDDGLYDGDEAPKGADPNDADTDNDGIPDGWEVANNYSPKLASDAALDDDKDDLTTLGEYEARTLPRNRDTDNDELLDGEEVGMGTDPNSWDTDHDRMPDGWELQYGLDPRSDDANADADGDAYDKDHNGYPEYVHTNLAEYAYGRPGTWNEAAQGAYLLGTFPDNADSDNDGASDGAEIAEGTNPRLNVTQTPGTIKDADNDGVTTEEELATGTNPSIADTDGDRLCDGGRATGCAPPCGGAALAGERDYGTNALAKDSDSDGLSDREEVCLFDPAGAGRSVDSDGDGRANVIDEDSDDDGLDDAQEALDKRTNPALADTDNDGLSDYDELYTYAGFGHAPNPLDDDTDDDGLSDGVELLGRGSLPDDADTDDDGLTDNEEAAHGTDPLLHDSDRDEMPDAYEVAHGLNPLQDDRLLDHDRDGVVFGLTNIDEYHRKTRPNVTDTDGDSINDYAEVALGLNPLADDRVIDSDHDGLANVQEYVLGTNPASADTDGDGLADALEATRDPTAHLLGLYPSDPKLADTDADGISDAAELAYWNTQNANAWLTDYDNDSGSIQPLANNLRDADSDNDGLDDGQEVLSWGTHPAKPDTDNDGDKDRDEIMLYGTDPTNPLSHHDSKNYFAVDADGDGLSDSAEGQYGTNPNNVDTDNDGIQDGAELNAWGKRWNVNYDNDTNPRNLLDPDSDNDGKPDGTEFATAGLNRRAAYITSPAKWDSDNDGIADGNEADNNLQPATPAAPNGLHLPKPMWADGVDAHGPYANGAYDITLRPTGPGPVGRSPAHTSESGSGRQGAPDKFDTDDDLLNDKTEITASYTDPTTDDSDNDGILDRREPVKDTDGDGLFDGVDTDADDDGIPDAIEDRNGDGKRDAGETSPYDADTDDDGLCDGEETKTLPYTPDTDLDGLSDGLEMRKAQPCTTAQRDGWTTPGKKMGLRSETWQPYKGPATPPPTNAAGKMPAEVADHDNDMIPDGIEDWIADGVLGNDETDPYFADSDRDGVPDSVELNFWGLTPIDAWIRVFGLAGLDDMRSWDATDLLATNPRSSDTDGDKIPDGDDLNPNGLNPTTFAVTFESIQILDPIDPGACVWGFGYCAPYAPELYFIIHVRTAMSEFTLDTGNLPELPVNGPDKPTPLAAIMQTQRIAEGVAGPKTYEGLTGGRLSMRLPENVRANSPTSNPGAAPDLGRVSFEILVGDADGGDPGEQGHRDMSDIIDVDAAGDRSEVRYRVDIQLGSYAIQCSRTPPARPMAMADGSHDGATTFQAGTNADDDARLSLTIKDNIAMEFLMRAKQVLSTSTANMPTSGQALGGC